MQSVRWYVRRIRAMAPAEILWRIRSILRDQADLLRLSLGLAPSLPRIARSQLSAFKPGFRCTPITSESFSKSNSPLLRTWKDRLVFQAEEICQNRLTYFDLESVDHGTPINWHRDHSAGVDAPLRPSLLTDYRDSSIFGDCKLVWEPNRHHQLVVLARAYVATQDLKYAQKVVEILRDWISANPFGYGLNWKSPLELGIRLINWIWAIDLVRESGTIDEKLWDDIQDTVYKAVWDIRRKFSQGSSANNHLIGEIAGVFIASCYFHHFPNAARLRLTCHRLLEQELLTQTYESGCTREHAFGYQLFVLQFFLLSIKANEHSGQRFSSQFHARLLQAYRFLREIHLDTGMTPNIGDCDNGYVLDLGERPDSPLELLATGALEYSDHMLALSDRSETVFWLYGNLEQERVVQMPGRSLFFSDSGYSILRSKRLGIIFDCAELGYGPLAAHGHADCLSFLLSLDGQPVFIDSGTFDYFTHPTWRDYFRSTLAHNTVEIDGESQSVMLGAFLWGQRANAVMTEWLDNPKYTIACGQHDGYRRLPDPVIHKRKLTLDKRRNHLSIFDVIECSDRHSAKIIFQLDPSCNAQKKDERTVLVNTPVSTLSLTTSSGTLDLLRPLEGPSPGWISRKYHQKVRSIAVIITLPVAGTTMNTCDIVVGDLR